MEILLLPLALLAGFVLLLVVGVVLRLRRGKPVAHDSEADVLRARYAIGELTREEYDRQRRAIREGADRSG